MWRPIQRTPEGFETFYAESRDRLLLQCYALTGDLPASQRAVRDAMVVAWHHWRKVARLERPEDWVRPVAWNRALRLRQVRRWARQKDLDPEVRATLDALGRLTTLRRRVLLLTALTSSPLDSIAREVGVTRARAERELQTATAELAVHRGVPSTAVRALLEQVAGDLAGVRWPRPSIVMRAGSTRRRTHTLLGVAVVVAALAVTGSLVSESGDAHPALASKGLTHGETSSSDAPHATAPASREPDPLTATALLGPDQVTAALPGQWTQGDTNANTAGDGLAFTCQAAPFADPQGLGALVRTFTGTGPRGGALTAGQQAEASADASTAEQAYTTTLDWYAGCSAPRVQLVDSYAVTGVGDEAALLVLRSWTDPGSTQVVGVARTGRLTTTTVTTQPDRDGRPASVDAGRLAGLLGAAVAGLCTLPGHGACATTPAVQATPAPPVGTSPGLVSTVDLPPVATVSAPWVGSDPGPATQNAAATRCDDADFSGFAGAVTRTFVIPDAQKKLPAEFGLTETAGVADGRAKGFVAMIRRKLAGCHGKDIGTDVTQVVQRSDDSTDLTVWRLDVDVSKKKTVRFLMAVLRDHGTVAQLTFVPSGDATIDQGDFVALAERAQQRLAYVTGTATGSSPSAAPSDAGAGAISPSPAG